MLIDFHTHIFPESIAARTIDILEGKSGMKAATNGTLEGLLGCMNLSGANLSVVVPVVTKPEQFETVNAFAVKLNEEYKGRLLSFGGIHPDNENYKEKLRQIKDMGLKGIKIHPNYQGTYIDDVRYMNIIEYASELDLIILTHAGIDIGIPEPIYCPPDKMRKVLDTIKPKKMVLGHYGGWNQWEEVLDIIAGQDVYLDTAFTIGIIEKELFLKILEKHDENKILFATDSPWRNTVQCVNWLRNLSISEEVKEKILGGNAQKLLGLQ